MTNFVLMCR